jgi:two-component system response regulator MtrA
MPNSSPWRILIVEDDTTIHGMVENAFALRNKSDEIFACENGEDALSVFKKVKPHAVILDWMLPGKDGIDILKEIRLESNVPIIMASAKTEIDDVDLAISLGADGYLKKPYGAREALTMVEALMKLPERGDNRMVEIGDIKIDVSAYEVYRAGAKILLTPLEFNLLLTIAEDPKHTFTREELLKKVWLHKNLNEESDFKGKVDTRLVNVHIQRLRSKIEENPDEPQIVTTIRGRGYKAGAF